jgi:hypothetical protein
VPAVTLRTTSGASLMDFRPSAAIWQTRPCPATTSLRPLKGLVGPVGFESTTNGL